MLRETTMSSTSLQNGFIFINYSDFPSSDAYFFVHISGIKVYLKSLKKDFLLLLFYFNSKLNYCLHGKAPLFSSIMVW